jgi:hypothetical protein
MNKTNVLFIIVGIFIGWITVPSLNAESDNTYRALLHKMIDIVSQIQITSAQTADNTRAIRAHMGAK